MNYLIGKVTYFNNSYAIVENNFVGYKVFISNNEGLEIDKYKKFYIYKRMQILNNSLIEELYGFTNFKERIFFERLIAVSGIGPKTGITILKNNLNELKIAIKENNIELLSNMQGINKKIASALVNELTIDDKDIDPNYVKTEPTIERNYKYEVISALQTLGYKKDIINQTISTALCDDDFDLHSEEELTDLISRLIKEMSKTIELKNS